MQILCLLLPFSALQADKNLLANTAVKGEFFIEANYGVQNYVVLLRNC